MNKTIRKATLLLGAFLIVLAGLYMAHAVVIELLIPSDGDIIIDGLAAIPTSIHWGNVMVGETYSETVTIKNLDSIPRTLSMTNDLPVADGVITWDKEGVVLDGGASLTATFHLTVDAAASEKTFSCTITVTGT